MANGTETQIDKLGIDISVRENDAAAKINAVAKAINQLRKSLVSLTDVSKQMNKITKMFSSLNIPKSAGGTKLKTPKDILRKIEVPEKSRTAMLKNAEIPDLNPADTEKAQDAVKGVVTNYSQWLDIQEKGNKQNKDAAKSNNKFALSFKTLLKSVGRIAFYRAIRTAIKEIVQAAKEGIENIRSVDQNLDDSLNRLSQSATTLKNSFAQLLSPIIQSLEPVITRLADSFATIVNRISEARAAMEGQDEYTKILTSDTEEYQEAIKKAGEESKKQKGNLLSFDTFTTQSIRKESTGYTGVTKEKVTMKKSEAESILKTVKVIENSVMVIAATIVGIKLAKLISSLKSVSELLGTGKGIFGLISGIAGIVGGLVMTIKGVLSIIDWNEETSGLQKFLDVLTVVLGVISAIAGVIALMKAKTLAGMIAGGVAITGVIGAIIASAASSAQKAKTYAVGGNFNTGDYFVANENGKTELVASSNTGGGSVMNLDQWASISYSSFYRALSDYDAAQNGRGGELDLNSLGRTIAGNTGFVNEMNRRNSTLNLI